MKPQPGSGQNKFQRSSIMAEHFVLTKGPAGQYFSDLAKACEDNFARIYPECVNSEDHGTVMCPPVFSFGYVAPTGQASGATALSKIEQDTLRGDDAELKIFHMLEKFGKSTNQPMFVFTQLKISEFIKTILRLKLPADHAIFNSPLILGKDLEIIDFLIIHRKIGVILVEVKAGLNFSNSVQRKAKSQLQNAEKVIHALLQQDVKHKIAVPVYKVIAMPNVNDRCYESEIFINLRERTVRSVDDFRSWWEKGFPEKKFGHHDKFKVQNLILNFVGQSSEVSADAVITDVCMKIEKQKFLQTSYNKSTRKAASGSKGVEKAEAVLAKQFMFLNPDQLRIWNGPFHQFFNGSSGSGKTILLQFKALECVKNAKNGEKVLAVVPSSLKALFQAFFVEHKIHSGVDVLSPTELRDLEKNEVRFHIFVDELQAFLTEIPDALKLLEKLIQMADHDCYCWIAYDYMQISIRETQDTVEDLLSGAKVHAKAQKASKTFNFHHGPCLSTTVRATFEVYSFVQAFVKKTLMDLPQKIELPRFDHLERETREILTKFVERYDVSNYLGHRICGPSVTVFQATGFEFITQIIQEEVKMWTNEDSLHHVAILLTDSVSKEHLSSAMARREIPVCDIGDQKNAVALDFASKALSYEWPVVIAISASPHLSSNYTMFTRAVARLVVITSEDSSEYFPSNDRII